MNPVRAFPILVRNTPDGVYFLSSAPKRQPSSCGYAYYAHLKTAATTTRNPSALPSPIPSSHPTASLKEVPYPTAHNIASLCTFLFFPSIAGHGTDVPILHPFRVVYFTQRPSGQ